MIEDTPSIGGPANDASVHSLACPRLAEQPFFFFFFFFFKSVFKVLRAVPYGRPYMQGVAYVWVS